MDDASLTTALDTDTGVTLKPFRRIEAVGGIADRRCVWTLEQKLALAAEMERWDHAKRSVEEADEAMSKARGAGATLTGLLRISGVVTFGRLHIVPRLRRFIALHPALVVEVFLDDGNVDLVEAGIDVAPRMGDLENSSPPTRRIARGPRLVLGAPRYFDQAASRRHLQT